MLNKLKYIFALTILVVCFFIFSAGSAYADNYDFPFWADDLQPGERISTKNHNPGIQELGKDIGAQRWLGGENWAHLKAGASSNEAQQRNEDYVVYGKPFYAAAAGEVIGCWRNAPENPKPGEHHPALAQKLMIGGGNHLWIRQDDGMIALYAHAIPGSIPHSICPYDDELFASPHDGIHRQPDVSPSVYVPAGVSPDTPTGGSIQRPRVQKGQFLGHAGNSGSSGNPHLHLHMEEPSQTSTVSHPMKFERGLWTRFNDPKADINKWASFAGDTLPEGGILIWPAQRLHTEYARHGFPASDFQRMFDHLADSGYWPEWIDGYSVNGRPYLNYVWRPAKWAWRAYFLLTASDYQQKFDQAREDGYAPIQVESSLVDGNVRYTVIFVKNKPGRWLARHGLTASQHRAVMDEAREEGLSPANISVVSVDGQRRYTVLYRQENIGKWQLKSQVAANTYQDLVQQNKQAGRKPYYISAYMHDGKPFFSVVFAEKPSGSWKARHNLTAAQYQNEFNSAHRDKLLTRVVSGYDGAKQHHRYAAVWRSEA